MKKVSIVILAATALFLIVFILMEYDNINEQTNAQASTSKNIDKKQVKEQYQFIQDVSKKLKQKGYKTVGTILSQEYKDRIEYVIPLSDEENKGNKTENDINKIFDEVSKSYKMKPFTVHIQNKENCCS